MRKLSIFYGLIGGFGVCTWIMAEYLLGLRGRVFEVGLIAGYFVVPIVTFYLMLRAQRAAQDNLLALNQGFSSGVCASLVAAMVIASFISFYNHAIDPSWLDHSIAWHSENMRRQGFSELQIRQNIEALKAENNFFNILTRTAFMGAATSFVITLVLRRAPAGTTPPAPAIPRP